MVRLLFALPLAALVCALFLGYGEALHNRYGAANGFAGEITRGVEVGQSFVARYDGLSGVEVRLGTYGRELDTGRSALVMRLLDAPLAGTAIATATLQPTVALERDGWYTFAFEPVRDSAGRAFYASFESPEGEAERSLTLAWFQPAPRGDPYGLGAAYRGGLPTPGDLAFGLHYRAGPFQVWDAMSNRAGVSAPPWGLWALLLLGAVLAVGVPFAWGVLGRKPRLALTAALLCATLHGLLFMLLIPPWQGPDEYAHFAYAALLDKHDLDKVRVEALAHGGAEQERELVAAVNASADRHDFTRRVAGNTAPGAPTRTDPFIFQQVRQPPTYYWLCALATRMARAIGVQADPYAHPETALVVMRLVSLALGLAVVALAWGFGRLLPESRVGRALPFALGLLPMHTFVSTVANNDILAEVAVTALFVALAALLKVAHAGGRPGLEAGLAALCILLAAAGVGTKATAPAAGLPMLALGLAAWGAIRLRRKVTSRARRGAIIGAAVVLLVAAPLLSLERDEARSAGWVKSYLPFERASRVASLTARDGTHVIELGTQGSPAVTQRAIPPLVYHPMLKVSLAGWARLAPGAAAGTTAPVTARLAVDDGRRQAGEALATLSPGGGWVRLEVSAQTDANAEELLLRLEARGDEPARVEFDDLSLRVEGVDEEWHDPIYTAALLDPSAEEAPWRLRPAVAALLPEDVEKIVSAALNPQPLSKPSLMGQYATSQFRSFWGSFGWLSIDLPDLFYWALLALFAAALLGYLTYTSTGRPASGDERHMGLLRLLAAMSLGSLFAAVAVGFGKQMALTVYGGLPSPPQGRYLFVLALPIVWLGLEGLAALVARVRAIGRRGAPSERPGPEPEPWVVAPSAALIVFFAAYCLLALVVPYYYG